MHAEHFLEKSINDEGDITIEELAPKPMHTWKKNIVICPCGSTYDMHTKKKHFSSIKHFNFMNPDNKKISKKGVKPDGKQIINCTCGVSYRQSSKLRHLKTITHYNFNNPDNPKPLRTNKPKPIEEVIELELIAQSE